MIGVINTAINEKRRAKVGYCRGSMICGVGADKIMGTVVQRGSDGIV